MANPYFKNFNDPVTFADRLLLMRRSNQKLVLQFRSLTDIAVNVFAIAFLLVGGIKILRFISDPLFLQPPSQSQQQQVSVDRPPVTDPEARR